MMYQSIRGKRIAVLDYQYSILLVCIFSSFLYGQSHQTRAEVHFPKVDENSFTYTDTNGFLWLGAYNGLYRFDGTNLIQVNIQDPNSEVRHGQNVQSDLFPATDGTLWFTTSEALHAYHPVTGKVRTFALAIDEKIISEGYRTILLDQSSGMLWLKASDRLVGFNTNSEFVEHIGPSTQGNFFATGKNKSGNQVILGMPWYNAENIEVFTQDSSAQDWSKILVKEPAKFINGKYIRPGLFFVGGVYGLYQLELMEGEAKLTKVLSPDLPNSTLYDIGYDSLRNELLLNFTKIGVVAYNLSTNTVSYRVENGERNFMTSWNDKQGNNWLSTGQGYQIIKPPLEPINKTFSFLSATDFSQSPSGTIILTDEEGRATWVNPNTELEHTHHWLQTGQRGKPFSGYHDTLFSLFSSSLQVFDKHNETSSAYRFNRELGRGITSFDRGKTLAISQQQVGWLHLSADSVRLAPLGGSTTFPFDQDYTFLRRLNEQTVAVVASATRLYFAAYRQQRLSLIDSVAVGAEVQDVVVHPSQADTYYIGTNTGLWQYAAGKLERIEQIGSSEAPVTVNALSFDHAGTLWLGTDDGLLAYDGKTIIRYNTIDGLPADLIFIPDQVARHTDGRLLFNTNQGVLVVSTKNIKPDTMPAKPYVSQLWINKAESEQLKVLNSTRTLHLGYQENDLRFRINAAAGTLPWETYTFTALLTGDHTSNQTIANGKTLIYDGLHWGDYDLLLIAYNHHGLPVGKTSYTFSIAPPFYQTWWFRFLAVAVVASSLYLVHYSLVRKAVAKQVRLRELQETVVQERDRIAEEVHDDLGGQLSSIMFISQSMLMKGEKLVVDPSELSRINELSKNSLQNVRDIIFTLDTRRSSLEDLFIQLENVGRETFVDHHIEFVATADLSRGNAMLNSKEKRNLTLLVKETFHNIIKHAGASKVTLSLTQPDPQSYRLCVVDNGIGINNKQAIQEPERISFGLQNMERKCQELGATLQITDATPTGTKVLVSGRIKSKKT